MWDTYSAFAALLIVTVALSKKEGGSKQKRLPFHLTLYAFIGLEADVLFRIFLFIPCQTYRLLFFFAVEELQFIWLVGALTTPIQAALSSLFTSTIGIPLMKTIKSDKHLDGDNEFPLRRQTRVAQLLRRGSKHIDWSRRSSLGSV